MQKRIIAAVLCLIMLFTSIPVQEVNAAESGGVPTTYTVTYQGNENTGGTVPVTETVSAGASYMV